MEFLEQLIGRNQDFVKSRFPTINNRIKASSDVYISIQGSKYHYSRPRENMSSLKDFTAFELCFFDGEGNTIYDLTRYFEGDMSLLKELEKHKDINVYGFVDVELIERVYQFLKNKDEENQL